MGQKMGEKKLDAEQIIFKDDGLKAIRNLISLSQNQYQSWQEKKLAEQLHARKVLDMLHKIGLLSFFVEGWRAQELPICVEFVKNWNSETNTTYVWGAFIDANLSSFPDTKSRCFPNFGTESDAASAGEMNTSFRLLGLFSPAPNQMPKGGFILDHCNQSIVKAVLKLLNMTLWTKVSGHHRVCGDLLYLVLQADEGMKPNWKKLFHNKFLWEMARLKALLQRQDQVQLRVPRLQTVLGPVMCYMYSQCHRK